MPISLSQRMKSNSNTDVERAYPSVTAEPGSYPSAHNYPSQEGQTRYAPQQVQVLLDESLPTGLILFVVGFCCWFTWIIGAFCLGTPKTQREFLWRKINRIMAVMSIVAVLMIVAGSIVFFTVILPKSSSSTRSTP